MDKRKYIEELRLLGEEVQKLEEKNCPTNPSKWSYYKSQAKQKFDVYPSAYANGWASKQYKAAGGGWKQCAGESVNEANSLGFEIGDFVHFKSKNKTGMVKKISGDKVTIMTMKGDFTGDIKDVQVLYQDNVNERLDKTHLGILKYAYKDIDKINPSDPAYTRLVAHLDKMSKDELKQIAGADIKFLSLLAKNRLMRNEDHSSDPNDKYVVRPCNNPNEPWAVWEGEVRVKGFATREEAQAYADAQNKAQGLGESANKGRINELSADTYKNTVKAALQRGDSKGNSIAVKALQSFGKAIAKELAGKSFEVAGARGINLAQGFYRGDSKKFINQFQMTFTGEGDFIESRNVKVFGSDEAHFHMKVEFQVPNNMGGWSSDVKFKGYEKYKFPGTIQFSIKQGNVWVWYRAADTSLEFTRAGAREMAKLADIIVTAMDFPTKAKHNTIKQFDPMKVNESVNEIRKGSIVIPYAMDKDGEFIVDKVFKNKAGETSYTGKFKKSGEAREFILHSKDKIVKESKSLKEFDADTYRKKQAFVIGPKFAEVASDKDVELMARLKRANSEHAWQLKQNIASMEHLYKKYKIQSSKGVEK